MNDEQALREKFEAQASEIAEHYCFDVVRTDEQDCHCFAENLRRMGVPAIRAYREGTMLVAEVAEPAGEG